MHRVDAIPLAMPRTGPWSQAGSALPCPVLRRQNEFHGSLNAMISSLNTIVGRLHFKQLRLLVALADHGSLLNAAREVAMSQPGASKALKEIESTFGIELFTRTNRGLEPNPAGRCVIKYARLFQTDIAHLREELIGVLSGSGGRVAAGMIMGAVPLMTEAVSALVKLQPQMSVELIEDTSASLLALLDEGRIDLAVCRSSVSRAPEQYTSVDIQSEALTVVAHAHHPLAKKKRVGLEDVVDARWIVYRANMPIRRLFEQEFDAAGLKVPLYLIETTSAFATSSLLRSNPGMLTLLPVAVADQFVQQGWATRLPLTIKSGSEPYALVTRKGAAMMPGAHLLTAELHRLSYM